MVSFWKNEDDLYGKCSISLMKSFQAYPRIGWIKATATDNTQLLSEITRLSRENHVLRTELEGDKKRVELDKASEVDRTIDALRANDRPLSVFKNGEKEWTKLDRTTLLKIFESMAPDLLDECAESKLIESVAFELSGFTNLRKYAPIPTNYLRNWLGDLASLGVIAPSEKRHSVHDRQNYWTLTDLGREAHRQIRRNELLKGLVEAEEEEEEDEEVSEAAPIEGASKPSEAGAA